jgi:acetyltransferase-like isoleucine patch superfamily enzyme
MLLTLKFLKGRQWPKGVRIHKPVFVSPAARIGESTDGIASDGVIEISKGARIAAGAILEAYGGSIAIGENVYIGPYCVIYGHGGLRIGRDVMIAAGTKIIPANHIAYLSERPFSQLGETRNGISIGDNVWIGSNCVVLDGVSIESNTVVAAGAVVSKSLSSGWIYAGVPAQPLRVLATEAKAR